MLYTVDKVLAINSWLVQILPPVYSVFPVEDADLVFRRLSQSKIDGRAVLRVFSDAESSNAGSGSSFLVSTSADSMPLCSPGPDDLMTCCSPDAVDLHVSKGFFLP